MLYERPQFWQNLRTFGVIEIETGAAACVLAEHNLEFAGADLVLDRRFHGVNDPSSVRRRVQHQKGVIHDERPFGLHLEFLGLVPKLPSVVKALCPVGRAGTPDEVGAVGALLMGPDGTFITGSDFLMDGGVTASYFYGELAPK